MSPCTTIVSMCVSNTGPYLSLVLALGGIPAVPEYDIVHVEVCGLSLIDRLKLT